MSEVALAIQLAEAKSCITFKACVSAYGMRDNRTNEAYTGWMNSMNNVLTSNLRLIAPADYINFPELVEHHEKMLSLCSTGSEEMVPSLKILYREAFLYLRIKFWERTKTDYGLLDTIKAKWDGILELMADLNLTPIPVNQYAQHPVIADFMEVLNLKVEGGFICFATSSSEIKI